MRLFTISNQSRLYGEYISHAIRLRLMNCRDEISRTRLSVLFRGRAIGIRTETPGTRGTEECGAGTGPWVMSGIGAVGLKKYRVSHFVLCKTKISATVKCQVRLGLLTRHEREKLHSSLFAVLLFAGGGRNSLATSGSLGHEIWNVYIKLKTWGS